jgi:hypothetical protein
VNGPKTLAPAWVTPRQRGQTAIYDGYEWIYNPRRLTDSTWRQILELAAAGEGHIQVIQWPEERQPSKPWRSGMVLDDSDSKEPAKEGRKIEVFGDKSHLRLADVDPDEPGIPYAQWKAAQLNEIFRRHGMRGQPWPHHCGHR